MSEAQSHPGETSLSRRVTLARMSLHSQTESPTLGSATTLLLKTVTFAAEKHVNQRRKNATKSPYINHPIGVANILSEEAGVTDLVTLQGALLHDTVEDTNTTFEEIESLFGKAVCDVVRDVTDNKSLPKDQRKMEQVRHAPHTSDRAKLVKLADKLHNLRDIIIISPPWGVERIQGYFIWSREVANGLQDSNSANILLERKLEDLFASEFTLNGVKYPTIPSGDTEKLLDEYYASMKVARD